MSKDLDLSDYQPRVDFLDKNGETVTRLNFDDLVAFCEIEDITIADVDEELLEGLQFVGLMFLQNVFGEDDSEDDV